MSIIGVDGMPLVNKCTNSYHRENCERAHYGAGTLGQEKRYMHINVHTLTHIYMGGREHIHISGDSSQETP
jgi:hypothetical protein